MTKFRYTSFSKNTKGVSSLFEIYGKVILVDCGKFWDDEKFSLPFNPSSIHSILITHAHSEHFSGILTLLGKGFKGKIYMSRATAEILPYIYEEHILCNFSISRKLTDSLINQLKKRIFPCEYGKVVNIAKGIDVRFKPAHHIIGSSFVEIDIREGTRISEKIVVSGDLGATQSPLLKRPLSPWRADFLVLESTFGDVRFPPPDKRRARLIKFFTTIYNSKGIALIPSSSFGRVQEFLFEFNQIFPDKFYIVIDSPISCKIDELMKRAKKFFKDELIKKVLKKDTIRFGQISFISTPSERVKLIDNLIRNPQPTIIISPSDDLESGPSSEYFKALSDLDRFYLVLISRYNEPEYKRVIKMYEYSAHADRFNLLNFVKRMRYKPSLISLIHGEEAPKKSLSEYLKSEIQGCEII